MQHSSALPAPTRDLSTLLAVSGWVSGGTPWVRCPWIGRATAGEQDALGKYLWN